MEAFEKLIGGLLEREGYWVRYGFKVELSKAEKRRIGRPSCPRWEIDILAYKPAASELLVVECKSYFDSSGVSYSAVSSMKKGRPNRYKLFNDRHLRNVVFRRLKEQLIDAGLSKKPPAFTLCLAAGRIVEGVNGKDRASLGRFLERNGWRLFDSEWVRSALENVSLSGYEDDVAVVVAKLFVRTKGNKLPV
jgi:hypothetical protein